ncbi:Oidioi.mRNA.OKI2018_I69.chr2.g4928.t1.cds [Oikopleura dioica]|uniref:Oidioi.mRNA.OKI2018_I69.chr2.g4928.t1.cds n=1 Tax=Oikopleura dioica TaxID=34765 RepID=A0ABN7T800_OIKDI|nr:Oidioi.mRNA.OKI2018_I69.chr2.g4928.t1.cds [Oikopleura dioica]
MRIFSLFLKCLFAWHTTVVYQHYPDVSKNWADAVKFCRELGGGAEIATIIDNTQFNEFLGLNIPRTWIGGTDAASEGVWVSACGGTIIGKWRPNQPDNSGNEDCLEMYYGLMNDQKCGHTNKVTCQFPENNSNNYIQVFLPFTISGEKES